LKVIFFGSSSFSIPFLDSIHNSDNKITLVVSGPEKSRGRGRQKSANPVKNAAEELGLDTLEFDDFGRSVIEHIIKTDHDYLVLVSFGKILPPEFVDLIKDKTINLHPSLLPRYRGPSPIISALLNGDNKTGVSLIKMSIKVDEGDIYMQKDIEIEDNDNNDILEQKVIFTGTAMLLDLLELLKKGKVKTFPQQSTGVSYTKLFTKSDLELDWKKTASELFNKIRAFSTSPGCFTSWKGKNIKILAAEKDINVNSKSSLNTAGGEIISADRSGLIIGCGDGKPISVLTLQPPGKKAMSYKDFINGYRIKSGDFFGQD
jgi:methionyl-tRNA formyltransferase